MGSSLDKSIFSLYKGKRVLLTGDTGFKGSWLSLWLHELGAEVVGYALPPAEDFSLFSQLGLDKMIQHVHGDIRDFSKMQKLCNDFQPEFLFHLAAQPIVRFSYQEPKLTLDTNVGGTVNVLEAVRTNSSLKAFIDVTSDKCYKNQERIEGYRETDELGGYDPYSASKASAELIFASYLNSFFIHRDGFGAASVRAGNVIGGGDWSSDRIVPDCIKSLQKKKPVILRNPQSTRPWQQVLEPLYGYLLLGSRLYKEPKKFSGSWNFGPDSESIHTAKEVAEKVVSCWGEGKIESNHTSDALHENILLQLNCDKAHRLLGWYPQWDFNRTVSETVHWYKEVTGGKSALVMSRDQIKSYQEGT